MNYRASSTELNTIYTELLYMVKKEYKLYYDYKTVLNGYITAFDGNLWSILNEYGEKITSTYNFIGLIDNDGKGLYINDIDTRILDLSEITRVCFIFKVEDTGYYNEKSDLIPVKMEFEDIKLDLYGCHIQNGIVIAKENGSYNFYDADFNKICAFETDDICVDGRLVAFRKGGKWGYADVDGKVVVEPQYVCTRSFSKDMLLFAMRMDFGDS